eukprot:UN18713
MGVACRWLKVLISEFDSNTLDASTITRKVLEQIDHYIQEKVKCADLYIVEETADKIKNNDVVMIYGRSTVVEKALLP